MYRRSNVFYRVLDAVFRNQRLVLTTLLCVAIPVGLLLITKSKGYMAVGAVRISQEARDMRLVGGGNIDNLGWKTAAETHVDTFTSLLRDTKQGGFVDKVFQRAGLTPSVSFAPGSDDKRIEALLSSISLKKEQDNLFTVSLNWGEGDECQRLTKALVEQYIEEQMRGKQQTSQKAAEFLATQIEQVQKKVDSAARALQRFQQQHPDVGPDQQQETANHLTYLRDRLSRAKIAAATGGKRQGGFTPRLPSLSPFLNVDSEPADMGTGSSPAQKRLAELTDQRDRLTTGEGAFRPDTAAIRALDHQILQTRLDVSRERKHKGPTTRRSNPEYERLKMDAEDATLLAASSAQEARELEAQIVQEERKLRLLPAIRRQADALIADLDNQKSYLTKLNEGHNEAVRKANLEREQASLVLQPVGDVYAMSLSGPKKKVTMGLVSMIIGLIVAGLMVAVREWSDPTLRYETDVEQFLDIPVLTGLTETRAVLAPKSTGTRSARDRKSLKP